MNENLDKDTLGVVHFPVKEGEDMADSAVLVGRGAHVVRVEAEFDLNPDKGWELADSAPAGYDRLVTHNKDESGIKVCDRCHDERLLKSYYAVNHTTHQWVQIGGVCAKRFGLDVVAYDEQADCLVFDDLKIRIRRIYNEEANGFVSDWVKKADKLAETAETVAQKRRFINKYNDQIMSYHNG